MASVRIAESDDSEERFAYPVELRRDIGADPARGPARTRRLLNIIAAIMDEAATKRPRAAIILQLGQLAIDDEDEKTRASAGKCS